MTGDREHGQKPRRGGTPKALRKSDTRRSFGKITHKGKRYYAEYTHDGARHTAGQGFTTQRQAENWLDSERYLIDERRWTPPKHRRDAAKEQAARDAAQTLTVAELVDKWLTSSDIKESTRRSHKKTLDLRALGQIDPLGRNVLRLNGVEPLGDLRVVDVDRARMQAWIDEMKARWPMGKDGYATSYYARKRLSTAFNYAIKHLELIDANPLEHSTMKPPKNSTKDQAVLSDEEGQQLIAAFPDWLQHAPRIMLFAGLRLGELLELRVKDLENIGNSQAPITLHVRRNMQDTNAPDGGKEVLINDTPKSEAAKRAITLDPKTSEAIRDHLKEFGKTNPEDLVVTRKNGTQFTQGNFRDAYFTPAKKSIGRPDISPHATRRYYGTKLVTFALAGEFSLEDARTLMGHETTEQLLEYMRAQSDYRDRAAAAFGNLFGG